MINKARESLTYIKEQLPFYDSCDFKLPIDDEDFAPIEQAIDQAEKNEKVLEILKSIKKDKYSTFEIQGNDLIIDVQLTFNDNEIKLIKEWLEK